MTDSVEDILAERQKTHGDYAEHARITQDIKAVLLNNGYSSLRHTQREALDMIAHKIGRIMAGNPNFKDHWDDIAGYAKLVSKDIDR